MKSIPVLFSFGRSGGTLVNQLLGTHPDCYVLSEVNPAASYKGIVEQASDWLGLVVQSQIYAFSLLPYVEQIRLLHDRAQAAGKQLVVRDWSSVNYVAGCSPYATPSGVLEQVAYLSRAGLPLAPLVVARRSVDVFNSWRANFEQFGDLDPQLFASCYFDYVTAVREYPVLRLEDLQAEPAHAVARLLETMRLSAKHLDFVLGNFHSFTHCTGNNTLGANNASSMAKEIMKPQSTPQEANSIFPQAAAVQLAKADKWLGYD